MLGTMKNTSRQSLTDTLTDLGRAMDERRAVTSVSCGYVTLTPWARASASRPSAQPWPMARSFQAGWLLVVCR